MHSLKGTGHAHIGFRKGELQLCDNFLDWGEGCKSMKKGKRALPISLYITVRKPALSRLRLGTSQGWPGDGKVTSQQRPSPSICKDAQVTCVIPD